jgi:GT2 family glycosyltransferase
MTRFSILTITFNAARFLEETLQSVAAQTYKDFEHLVWDGGSQDQTVAIARRFNHITLFEGKDCGIADGMNRIAAYAKGEYLLFLHADDFLAQPEALQLLQRALTLHPQCEWLYGRAHVVDEQGHPLRTTPLEPYSWKRLRKYNFITHPATLISSSLFQRVGGFNTTLRYCMDYDLWLRLASCTQPLVLTSAIACFREHRNSLSTSEPLKVAHEAYRVRNNYIKTPYERYRSYLTWKKRCKCIEF